MNNEIVVLCAKSGAGKDSLATLLRDRLNYNFVKLNTTRPMRPDESEGAPYYFTQKDDFLNFIKKDKMVEYRSYNTLVNNIEDIWYYGVHKDEIKEYKKYIVVLDIDGLESFKKVFGKRVISFYIETDDKIRQERSIGRGGFDLIEWNRRLKDDEIVFKNVINNVNNTIYNNDDSIEYAYAKLILKLKFILEYNEYK